MRWRSCPGASGFKEVAAQRRAKLEAALRLQVSNIVIIESDLHTSFNVAFMQQFYDGCGTPLTPHAAIYPRLQRGRGLDARQALCGHRQRPRGPCQSRGVPLVATRAWTHGVAQAKTKKHRTFDQEVNANIDAIETLHHDGEDMVAEGHFASADITARLAHIDQLWAELLAKSAAKTQRLAEAQQVCPSFWSVTNIAQVMTVCRL